MTLDRPTDSKYTLWNICGSLGHFRNCYLWRCWTWISRSSRRQIAFWLQLPQLFQAAVVLVRSFRMAITNSHCWVGRSGIAINVSMSPATRTVVGLPWLTMMSALFAGSFQARTGLGFFHKVDFAARLCCFTCSGIHRHESEVSEIFLVSSCIQSLRLDEWIFRRELLIDEKQALGKCFGI